MPDSTVEIVQLRPRGEAGILLEGRLHLPAHLNEPAGVAAVCHPDPRIGGTMDYPVVVAAAEALAQIGIAALRFNFRGVAQSEGTPADDGQSELLDAAGALDLLMERFDTDACFVAGYSFGALVALRIAEGEPAVAGAAMIALPQPYISPDVRPTRDIPRLFIIAENDQYTDPDWAVGFAVQCDPPAETLLLRDADHFLRGREAEIAQAVANFFAGLLEEQRKMES